MDIVWKRLDEITPYENNPRDNDQAVDAVASSIKEFGFKVPIVIDAQGVIVAGHTRHKAAKKLGLEKVPCIVADDLSDEQIRAFRLADNKTAELADWNEDLLAQELAEIEDIDMTLFGFGDEESDLADELEDNPYTMATNVPQYEPTGAKPSLSQLYDADKTDDLIAEIEASGLSKEEKGFLLRAAGRHTVFNYGLIAEYYAHASPEMQELMEKSALVIIDVDNAIANGYATLMGEVLDAMGRLGTMRDDFAVLILTHGRADNVVTMKTLQRQGYSGKWYMVIDDEDDMADDYRRNFGEEHIVTFCKQEAVDRADTMDNLDEHRAILYARNESFRIARDLGLKYFLMLDDDYSDFLFRFPEGKKLASKTPRGKTLERIFEAMLGFLDASGAATVAFAQGGDFIGGLRGGNFKKRLLRKAMNSFFCRVDRPIQFRGTMNEDVTTYTTLGSRGELFFTFVDVHIIQIPTQSLGGGMTAAYRESGTYLKTFYSVMSMPSCIKVGMMYSKNSRIHHRIDWECCVPKILNEKYRKER